MPLSIRIYLYVFHQFSLYVILNYGIICIESMSCLCCKILFLGTVLAPLFVVCKNFFLVPASANQMESKTVKGGDNVFLNCNGMGFPALFVA